MLEQLRSEEEAVRKESSIEAAAEAASAERGGGVEVGSIEETSPSRLVAVARSLSKGALEFVRPLRPDESSKGGESSASFSSEKIAEPIDADAFAAAVASQKRISLDPKLIILEKPIDEQGEHFVGLRMKLGGERVVVRALVGLATTAGDGGGGDEGKKGGKKKGGKR